MKKLLFFALLLLTSSLLASNTTNSSNNYIWPKFPTIDIEYAPGCPKGVHDGIKNCIGDCKVCYVKVSIGWRIVEGGDEDEHPVLISRDKDNKLYLEVRRDKISSYLHNAFFTDPSGKFVVSNTETSTINSKAATELNISQNLEIKAGSYNIVHKENGVSFVYLEN